MFHVLVIDDDTSFVRLLEKRLKSFIEDLSIYHFSSLAEVRAFLKTETKESFQLVFLDQHLPDGSGIDLLREGWFENLAVISVSSDDAPDMPGENVKAGAMYFLNKINLTEPLFKPLVCGILDRNKIQQEMSDIKLNTARMETVKTLVSTLRHEINNPLGAVLGAAYLLKNSSDLKEDQKEAARLVESSGKRIKHVLDELCKAISLEPVSKAEQRVFHIPGDKPWE
ncbi:MAG: response regulator [SAR324 cluster bacterium]|uniref:Response regulator n=1 Tax=SAR324 cluster bacterium TaxID=2024889 RepID=A0A7X9IJE9_9DELT|nr:response regulator [SAR324 cluster bacterium]